MPVSHHGDAAYSSLILFIKREGFVFYHVTQTVFVAGRPKKMCPSRPFPTLAEVKFGVFGHPSAAYRTRFRQPFTDDLFTHVLIETIDQLFLGPLVRDTHQLARVYEHGLT